MTVTDQPTTAMPNRAARRVLGHYETARREHLDIAVDVVVDDQTFTAYPARVSAAAVLDMTRIAEDSDSMRLVFHQAFGEDFPRFWAYIKDEQHPIHADTLNQIVQDLMEAATGFRSGQS